MSSFRIAVFADKEIGKNVVDYLCKSYPQDIGLVVCTDVQSLVYSVFNKEENFRLVLADNLKDSQILDLLRSCDYIILAWWPYIIKSPLLSITKKGIINFHPSLLPYNKGKHYNFWTIVEDTPFGVSLHFVDGTIDGGDIIFQETIQKDWTDTGQTLYMRAQKVMFELFCKSYEKIRRGDFTRIKQETGVGSFHFGKELTAASRIDINKEYKARDLINLIRAKTFPPHPGAWFEDGNEKFEIFIEIKKIPNT